MAYLGLQNVVHGNTATCIESIFTLHFPTAKKVLDCTFGAGRFWKWDHQLDITGIDIDPPIPVTMIADYRNLPFKDGSFEIMCFDPMFLFGKSKGIGRVMGTRRFFTGAEACSVTDRINSNISIQLPKNPADLIQNHYRRIFEQAAIASTGLIFKGQDLIVSDYRDLWSHNVIRLGEEMGFGQPTDYLIQVSKASRMTDPRWKTQNFYRTANCLYLVYKYGKGRCKLPKREVALPSLPPVEARGDRENMPPVPLRGETA